MKLWIGSLIFVSTIACGESDAPRKVVSRPAAPPQEVAQSRSGLAEWTLISSDCESGQPELRETFGSIRIDRDTIFLDIDMMPELSGPIVDGRAEISGETTFQGAAETITCSVDGVATIQSSLVVAQVTEILTSASELNCREKWSIAINR